MESANKSQKIGFSGFMRVYMYIVQVLVHWFWNNLWSWIIEMVPKYKTEDFYELWS